jgi:hypothetical protein
MKCCLFVCLFAVMRFEKSCIITAKILYETQLSEYGLSSKDMVHLGWNWVVKKNIGKFGLSSNGVILLDEDVARIMRMVYTPVPDKHFAQSDCSTIGIHFLPLYSKMAKEMFGYGGLNWSVGP